MIFLTGVLCIYFQIYTGPNQQTGSRGIQQDDQYLGAIAPGVFVAVYLSNYKKMPVIGKVLEIDDDSFKLHYWKGSYSKAWQPHMVKHNKELKPWTDSLSKQSVILCAFELDKKSKFFENSRKFLKRWYREEAKRKENLNSVL